MSDTINPQFVPWIRQASPYIHAHRQKTFVLAIGGDAVSSDKLGGIVQDIALLKSLGVNIVLVFGVRPQLDSLLKKQQLSSTYTLNNLRVTTAQMMETLWAASGHVSQLLQAAFSSGLPDSPLHGAQLQVVSTNAITAKPLGVLDGIDYQHTGQVRKVNTALINNVLAAEAITLVPPLGYSLTGETFNLEYLELAGQVASAIGAQKLIIYSKHTGILDAKNQCLREIKTHQVATLKPGSNTQRKILDIAVRACEQGVDRTHVINYNEDGSLLKELLTRDGCGSLISANGYDDLRQATIADISGIMALIEPLEAKGVLVRRERELLETEIGNFVVITRDSAVIGCAAVYVYSDDKSAELACIVSHENYKGQNVGERLLEHIESSAKAAGANTLFVLTTQTAHWFAQQGFKSASIDALPSDKQQLYNYQRASKVFQKNLPK